MDHPHLGEAIAEHCLLPLDAIFAARDLERIAARSIGQSFQSYQMGKHLYALPLDAAAQVMAYRADKVRSCPVLWSDVICRAETQGDVGLCLAGPHALLCLMSMACALDPALDMRDATTWIEPQLCTEAYQILQGVYAHAVPGTWELNPIAMLQAMATEPDIALCPLIYGYVNYSQPPEQTLVRFADAPRTHNSGRPGSILGGTGIAISRRASVSEPLKNHLIWLLSEEAQRGFIPAHDGQPSARCAWQDVALNEASANFYAATTITLEAAAIRPRLDGYIAFQKEAAALLRAALADGQSGVRVAQALQNAFTHHCSNQETTS
ncbi:MAG: carbohydrate ABC transporter substrate-binding protein [Devosiaceae bacterium]